VLRKSDPDECFEANPTLFWVILFVVTRRYAKDSRIFAIIVENLSKDVWTLLSSPIMGLEAIHCLLIIGAWPLPTIRFASDPSTIFSGIAVHGCMLLGLHTGKGCHPEFCVAARNHITCSDQEASASWLQACILASRSASSLGHPPPSIQLNDAPAKKALATPEWAYLLVEFDIQKFLNRLHLAMASHIASNGFVTESMVTDWENELETLRSIISRHDTGIQPIHTPVYFPPQR
jgi:transcriptional regulatory protein LEU3